MRIEGVNCTFTLALVENFPCVQGLDGNNIFIKIAPIVVVMTKFMNKSKVRSNWGYSKDIIKLNIRERRWNKNSTSMSNR